MMLGILSRQIDQEIFQPNYLLSDKEDLRDVLNGLAETDPEKESFLRSLLLSIDPEEQTEEIESRIEDIVQTVSKILFDLLTKAQYERLQEAIERIVRKAIEIWHPIQYSQNKYESGFASSNLRRAKQNWKTFQFPGQDFEQSEVESGQAHQSDYYFVIFPPLTSIHPDNTLKPATLLLRSQKMCVGAERERIERQKDMQEPSSPTGSRRANKRRPSNASPPKPYTNGHSNKSATANGSGSL